MFLTWVSQIVNPCNEANRLHNYVDNPVPHSGLLFLLRHPYLSGMWFGDIFQKHMCLKEIGLRTQNMITILDSIVNIIREGRGEVI